MASKRIANGWKLFGIEAHELLSELDAERARAEAAEAQLAALREAARPAARILDRMHMEEWGPLFETLTNTTATAEAYTRRVRAEALREAARTIDTWEASDDRRVNGYQESAEHLRAEAERTLAEPEGSRASGDPGGDPPAPSDGDTTKGP